MFRLQKLQHEGETVAKEQRRSGSHAWQHRGRCSAVAWACIASSLSIAWGVAFAALSAPDTSDLPTLQAPTEPNGRRDGGLFLREIRLQGATLLSAKEIEQAIYPFLGPGRSEEDVEKAREALQALYYQKGYQTVSVLIPQQKVRRGVVVLQVNEVAVGKVRVRGADYYEPEVIRERLPSLSEGTVPNFNEVMKEVVALNSSGDIAVDPAWAPGSEPNTFDVELAVDDSLPLHGSLELNNRNSANTTALRLNGSLNYDNLWQAGNSVGANFQISPEAIDEVQVFSGYYRARFSGLERFSLTLSGVSQDSNISTLGGGISAGRGYTIALLANYRLPTWDNYYQSFSFGVDYKHSTQITDFFGEVPIDYMPVTLSYSGAWYWPQQSLNLFLGFTSNLRTFSSTSEQWDENRYRADASFNILRGNIAYTAQLVEHLEGFWRLHGQFSDGPLITAEQSPGGGMDSVRGYYEGEVLGDQSAFGTFELRTDVLSELLGSMPGEAQANLYAFADGGVLNRRRPLPEEKSYQYLASIGFGARFELFEYLSGTVNFGMPLIDASDTRAWRPRVTFIIRGDF